MQIAHCTFIIANTCHSELSHGEFICTVRYRHGYKSYHSLRKNVGNVDGSLHEAGAVLAVSQLCPGLLCQFKLCCSVGSAVIICQYRQFVIDGTQR